MPGVLRLLPLQGALLAAFIPRALPWAKSFCPFRACCLCPFPWAKSFCPFRACCSCPFPGLRASALQGVLLVSIPRAKSFCPFRACCLCPFPGLRASAPSGRAACVHSPGLRASALSGRVGQNLRDFYYIYDKKIAEEEISRLFRL